MAFYVDGERLYEGTGESVGGSPINSVVFLANTLADRGEWLRPGDLVLSGAIVPAPSVRAGQSIRLDFGSVGTLDVRVER